MASPANEVFNGVSIWKWLNTNGTVPGFRIIYLQRLADPTRPWAADTSGTNPQQWNPYRTVDAMTVDLTTFNGLTSAVDPDFAATAARWTRAFRGPSARRKELPARQPCPRQCSRRNEPLEAGTGPQGQQRRP